MKRPDPLTPQQFRSLIENGRGTQQPKPNKYGAVRTGDNASIKEHDRAGQLRLLQRAGQISNLREQVEFLLIPAQRNSAGYMERAVKYRADFVYTDNRSGLTVVEDTKGFRTPDYIIKRKLMLFIHGITILET